MQKNYSKAIKELSEDDRPREKMLLKGKEALSNAELIAVLIGSGTRKKNAVELAKEILAFSNHEINQLAKLSLKELMQFDGIGEVKALCISAALELGRRRKSEEVKEQKIRSSESAYQILEPLLADLTKEEFWILLLSQSNKVIAKKKISAGGFTATHVDRRIIVKEALLFNATGVILAHNHPSGSLSPSKADLALTKTVQEACQLMDIRLLDHIIVTQTSYVSFLDEGLL